MIKRTVTLIALLLAILAPAALADSGTPPAAGQARPAGNFEQRLERLHQRIQTVTQRFVQHCGAGATKRDAERCTHAAQRMLERLQKVDSRIDARIAAIKEHCSGNPVPRRCVRADDAIRKLQAVRVLVDQLAGKVQAWLGKTPAPAAGGSSSGSTSTSTGDDAGLESLDQLAADLAAAQAAAGN